MSSETFRPSIGFLGRAMLSARFRVQWMVGGIRRESFVTHVFWWFSPAGGATLLAYAIRRQDRVSVTGQAVGLRVCMRNLMLIRASVKAASRTASGAVPGVGVSE
ncbi:MAG: lipid-A-disaccharide synthase N-terminal domain-containing protein [Pseudomonadota bacterium]|jgi:lipid-A-disaccharide synthase-like uncharacterized protein